MTCFNKKDACLQFCRCNCYDITNSKWFDECVCGHREHNGLCSSGCCQWVECKNHTFCDGTVPAYIADCKYGRTHPQFKIDHTPGICTSCVYKMGKHVYTNQIEDCCVCLENKNMIVLTCNHKVCNDCWFNITKNEVENTVRRSLCPLCRNLNG